MTSSENLESGAVGVVVGRFQVPSLHKGHLGLLDHVCNLHKDVLIILGSTPAKGTTRDPMDFDTRKAMFVSYINSKTYTNGWMKVANVNDHGSDKVWSESLDNTIKEQFPGREVILYGGRDSFIPHYHGIHKTSTVPEIDTNEGKAVRASVAKRPLETEDFRKGVIYGSYNQWPRVFMTVDMGVIRFHDNRWEILLARKWTGDVFRFIGGFVDPTDKSAEAAALRELKEETNLSLEKVTYVTSSLIEDWRYKETRDKIMTTLFVVDVTGINQEPKPGDDITEVHWIPLYKEGLDKEVHPSHQGLLASVRHYAQDL